MIGVFITIAGLLPLDMNATQQCPGDASSMADGSHCIIGAPIGPPLWTLGATMTSIGGIGLIIQRMRHK